MVVYGAQVVRIMKLVKDTGLKAYALGSETMAPVATLDEGRRSRFNATLGILR
jgi:hypothetical protein